MPVKKGRSGALGVLVTVALLLTALSACASRPPSIPTPLKETLNLTAAVAASFLSDADARNATRQSGGTWQWDEVRQGVGTFRCQGDRLGAPKWCYQVGPP